MTSDTRQLGHLPLYQFLKRNSFIFLLQPALSLNIYTNIVPTINFSREIVFCFNQLSHSISVYLIFSPVQGRKDAWDNQEAALRGAKWP